MIIKEDILEINIDNSTWAKHRPTLEQAEFLFNKFPKKPLREWGEDWGVSHEQVRIMKIKLGIPTSRKVEYTPEVAQPIIDYISEGMGTINTTRTFKGRPFGKTTFLNWMAEYPELSDKVIEAQNVARDKKLNPTHKRCSQSGEMLPVSEFYKDSNTLDGYSSRSKEAVKANAKKYYQQRNVPSPTVTEKVCPAVSELGPLPAEYFGQSTKHTTGLQTYCKEFQRQYQKLLNKGDFTEGEAYELAKEPTFAYFEGEGFLPKISHNN
tara:strand:- start:4977 stop:5774 length:798 start_codon:yes stop_codon:yes gene_type:complete